MRQFAYDYLSKKSGINLRGIFCPAKTLFFLFATLLTVYQHSVLAAAWESLPFFDGEMTSIAISDDNPAIIYVGTRSAGIFKSIDSGQTWQPSHQRLTFYPIRSLAIDPNNSDILYAGTDYDGIWNSTDGGVFWEKIVNGFDDSIVILDIIIDPRDSNTIYTVGGKGIGLDLGIIQKTEDGGKSWVQKDSGIPRNYTSTYTDGTVNCLAIDPADLSVLYAGTYRLGIYQSMNGSERWSPVNNGLPYKYSLPDQFESIGALAFDPHHSNRPGAMVGGNYFIFDSDNIWVKVSLNDNYTCNSSHLYYHPSNPLILYGSGAQIGSGYFCKSGDGGQTWEKFLGHPDTSGVSDIAFHVSSPDRIYAAVAPNMEGDNKGGVYKSIDQGQHWVNVSQGITAAVIRSVATNPIDRKIIFIGTGDGRAFYSADGDNTWEQCINKRGYDTYFFGSEIDDIAVDFFQPNIVFLASTSL